MPPLLRFNNRPSRIFRCRTYRFTLFKRDNFHGRAGPQHLYSLYDHPIAGSKACRDEPLVADGPVEREHPLPDLALGIHDQRDGIPGIWRRVWVCTRCERVVANISDWDWFHNSDQRDLPQTLIYNNEMEENNLSNNTSIPQETITWLLGSQTPSIRYLTLTKLLHKPSSDPDVLAVRSLIPTSKPVKAIFSKQDPEGFWVSNRHDYSP